MDRVLKTVLLLAVAASPLLATHHGVTPQGIAGDYLEARTSDVYTGSCFANAEVNLAGREAVLAWSVREGSWKGVPVQGLSVIAVVHAAATLGDPHANPLPARSILLVDERADAAQREALVGFAREMAGDLLSDVVAVQIAPIHMTVGGRAAAHGHHAGGEASLRAGDLVELRTRSLNHTDHLCGNEEVYYDPLTPTAGAVPAVTLAHSFRGKGLGITWSSPGKRSAFVGTFARFVGTFAR
jgi:hypothetical protein